MSLFEKSYFSNTTDNFAAIDVLFYRPAEQTVDRTINSSTNN